MEIKLPPNSIEAEMSVIGAVLIDTDAIVKVAEFLRAEHFYKDAHVHIFAAILDLYEKRQPIDLVTVPAALKKKKKLRKDPQKPKSSADPANLQIGKKL